MPLLYSTQDVIKFGFYWVLVFLLKLSDTYSSSFDETVLVVLVYQNDS